MSRSAKTSGLLDEVLGYFNVAGAVIHDIRTGRVNRHWRIVSDGSEFALRRYAGLRSASAIAYEHDVLDHLLAKNWPVAVPIRNRAGLTVTEIGNDRYALFPLLPGKPAPYSSSSHLRRKGRLLARLDDDMASWQAPGQREGFGRVWELDTYVRAQCQFETFNELLVAFQREHPELARGVR